MVDGYKVHGRLGYILIKLPALYYVITKSIMVLLRSLYSGFFIKFIYSFDYILLGLHCQITGIKNRSGTR
jgi:hypothetical protein